ncbi:MAG: SprT family zinc-dependent metalloprotease [Elusimicrobiota bacterium]
MLFTALSVNKSDELTYRLRRSRRRTLGLQIDPDGSVVARVPFRAPLPLVDTFIRQHLPWIHRTQQRVRARLRLLPVWRFEAGEIFPVWGELRALNLSVDAPLCRKTALTFYRLEVEKYAKTLLPVLTTRVGTWPQRLSVGLARHRWGSCSSRGHIRLNARLAMMPPELLEYVLVHELAHLRQPNHSPRFWEVVESGLPDYRERRKRLRDYSAYLTL